MIYFLGDIHSGFDHILPAIKKDKSDHVSVIFLGDIESKRPFEEDIEPLLKADIDVWLIHGNHDTDSIERWENLKDSQHRNLNGRIIEIDEIRIGGLSGVFRGEIWHPGNQDFCAPNHYCFNDYKEFMLKKMPLKRRLSKMERIQLQSVPTAQSQTDLQDLSKTGKLLKHLSTIFPNEYDALSELKADILVTHEAPSCHPNGFKYIDILAQKMGVKTMFHGHHHDSLDYSEFRTELGFEAHGVGFRGITDMHGQRVLPGTFDKI
jgi:predicted phosphodiesterase